MSVAISAEILEKIEKAYYVWLTTVRADGTPQPTPIWFIYENGTLLFYSQPNKQKLLNIAKNPKVTLSYNHDEIGEDFFVITGQAKIEENPVPAHRNAAYLAKYADGIQRLGWTPEGMAADYSVAVRVTPNRVRGE